MEIWQHPGKAGMVKCASLLRTSFYFMPIHWTMALLKCVIPCEESEVTVHGHVPVMLHERCGDTVCSSSEEVGHHPRAFIRLDSNYIPEYIFWKSPLEN